MLAALVLAALSSLGAAPAPRLERVFIVMRHGVRPPTKSAAAMASLADQPWPDDAAWRAAPGDLTPHGAAAIRLEAKALRGIYAGQGLIPAAGDLNDAVAIWADGGDERTRETAKAFAEGFGPAPPAYAFAPAGLVDPLFDGLGQPGCALDPAKALAAVAARGPVSTPKVLAGLVRLQQIVAPGACAGGAGQCLSGPSGLAQGGREVKLTGPVAVGATLAETLLLEYENDLPPAQLGWGRLSAADLATVMAVHDRDADLTRATPYIAVRRAGPLAREILAVLSAEAAPAGAWAIDRKLIVFVGHDTNLSNLAGAFGLTWSLPGQPDATAPGVALAFERWRDPATNEVSVRVRLFYQTPDQVRNLSADLAGPVSVTPTDCPADGGACSLARLAEAVNARLPADCFIESP